MGLLMLFLVYLHGIFFSVLEQQLRSQSISFLQQDAQFLLSRLQYDVSRATTILTPASLGDDTNVLELLIDGQSYTYSVLDGNLILTTATTSASLNSHASSVSSLNFRRVGNVSGKPFVSIEMGLSSRIEEKTGLRSISQQATFGIR